MPSKLGPHFIGTPGIERWIAAGTRVFKFDPSSLGASFQMPAGHLVVGKLDQREDRLNLTDWKAYKNQGWTPQQTAQHRFDAQRNIYVGANKPRVNRYEVNPRIDIWEDDNEVVPDNPAEAQWYAAYCIAMMQLYESIGKKRANFNFAVGTPHIQPGSPNDVWPHLIPAIRHAHAHGHYIALHEYMGCEADYGVGYKQINAQRQPVRQWHGRTHPDGRPNETYPYGYVVLRYRQIYDLYLRPHNLHTTPLLITECGCDSVETVTPLGKSVGTWKEHVGHWAAEGKDPESHYAAMLQWYDQRLREDDFVKGAMIFTVGSVGNWVNWDISGTRVEERILGHIAAERNKVDTPIPHDTPVVVTQPEGQNAAAAEGFSTNTNISHLTPGQTFQATWTFRNTGTTTWDSSYRLFHTMQRHAENKGLIRVIMGATSPRPITDVGAPAQVRPGETVKLTLPFKAPGGAGIFSTSWQLKDGNGNRFGPIRWMRVVVVAEHRSDAGGG